MEISFLNSTKDYEEELGLGIKTKEKPISIFEIKCKDIEEYRKVFRGVITILSDYTTRLITIISEPVPLKIPIHYKQAVIRGKKLIQTGYIDVSMSHFLENYFSENEFRFSNDFLCIGEVESWESKPLGEFIPVSFIDLKGLFYFSEELKTIQGVMFELDLQSDFLAKLERIIL